MEPEWDQVVRALRLRVRKTTGKGVLYVCCPFHSERTASMVLRPKRDHRPAFYFCYGCKRFGDVWDFARENGVPLEPCCCDGGLVASTTEDPRQLRLL